MTHSMPDGQAPAASGPHRVAVVCETRGDVLIAPVDYDLAELCIKCGSGDAPRARVAKVTKAPFWIWLTCIGVCPFILLYFLTRKVSKHPIRLCAPCARSWSLSWLWQVLAVVLLPAIAVATGLALDLPDRTAGWILIGALFVAFVIGPLVFARARLGATKIDDGYVELVGVSPDFARKLGVPPEGQTAVY